MTSAEGRRLSRLHRFERELWDGGLLLLCGVDEVGRGPLAGPVTAGAVVIDRPLRLEFLDDSKVVTELRRIALDVLIREQAIAVSVGWADHMEVDSLNILGASRLAMHRAIAGLGIQPCKVLVDGYPLPDCAFPQISIVDGDAKSAAIAAASIVAKVARDALMTGLDATYPGYGFAHNKGYATPDHLAALNALGPCPEHRRSFAPVIAPTFDFGAPAITVESAL
jgi:ribonuclease HII